MARKSRENPEVRAFILRQVTTNPGQIASLTAGQFGLSRVTVNRYLDKLVKAGDLDASGITKARRYTLKTLDEAHFEFQVNGLEEHVVWRKSISPRLPNLAKNVLEICEYGLQEMVNNVIDHSGSATCNVHFRRTAADIQLVVRDFGIGVFKKIADECKLNDQREAILELAKGKLTTDPSKHTGQGIFFTSRMFTQFSLHAGHLVLLHDMVGGDEDWLIETEKVMKVGTAVLLRIDNQTTYTIQDIFSKFEQDEDGARGFVKTHVPVQLALYENEQLVSRSQARRVLARFNKFQEVILNFKNVPTIGQAFADEIFRVYKNEHPEVLVFAVHASPQIKTLIDQIRKQAFPEGQLTLFPGKETS